MNIREKWQFLLAAAVLMLPSGAWPATVTINFSTTYQQIDGFGGSSAWSGALSDAVMDALYGNGPNQLGLTILRLRIDPHGSWSQEASNAKKAKARGATVFATPWSPPESLKTNGNTVKGGIVTSKYASFVSWMKSFWTYCGSDNVDIMSIENEPDYAEQITYEGCTWTAQNFVDFCKTYASQIGKPIMMPESFNYKFTLSDPTLNDAAAAKNVSYIGGHLYGTTPKKYTKALDLGKHVWETEHYYTGDNASSCMSTAKEIMDCMNCNFSAYVWWWMTYSSNEGIYASGAPNHRGWVIGQFSKWVRPGFYRVEATYNPQSGVYVTAFKGNQFVIVALNNSSSAQNVTFSFSNATFSSVNKYTSSQSKNGASGGAIAVANNSFSASLDAQSVTTFVGGEVKVQPSGSQDRWHTAQAPFCAAAPENAAIRLMYLVNGRQCRILDFDEPGMAPRGFYIVPQQGVRINIGTGKRPLRSGK